MNPHSKALDSMFSDMDDMEQKKMFGEPDGDEKGVSITISVTPQGEISEMNKGGMAYSEGGMVKDPREGDTFKREGEDPEYLQSGEMNKGGVVAGETDDLSLPPFLRKKKKG